MNITAVIMAGGKGERFWPKSRTDRPKQFLSLTDDNKTMIRLTAERIEPLVNPDNIFVVTNKRYKGLTMAQLPRIPEENILCEPEGRNTAPCIAFAAAVIRKIKGDSVMVILSADHLISDNEKFLSDVKSACRIASDGDNLVTLGISPAYAETGYGYINFDKNSSFGGGYKVNKFVEKPNIENARKYVESGDYLWNSGMFVWRTDVILNKFQSIMPDIYGGAMKIAASFGTADYEKTLEKEFGAFRSESIDYGILEKTAPIYTIPSDFGWDDVGGWIAMERLWGKDKDGNSVKGNVIHADMKNTVVMGDKRLIAVLGTEDLIIVDTDDALLVCKKNGAQNIKGLIAELKKGDNIKYL